MESNMRLRLEFEGSKILSDWQRAQGLKRSWFLLNPRHETISDLTDHLLCAFEILDSCPDGLLLSIDGFVLPPFESTSILKENDVIRVKRKRCVDIAKLTDGRRCLELKEVAEERLVGGGIKLLANEESGGYKSDSEEDEPVKLVDIEDTPKKTVSKKRKASNKPTTSKKKRKKSAMTEGLNTPLEDARNDIQPQQNGSSHQHTLLLEMSPVENGKLSDTDAELDSSGNSDIDETTENVKISMPSEKRSCQVKDNVEQSVVPVESGAPHGSNKSVSRSTRRKKLKRQWMREQRKAENAELKQAQLDKTDNQPPSGKDNSELVKEHRQPNVCNYDEDGEIVPVVVRPGHIRFEPFDKADADEVQHCEISVENFQWNGITSKRKGQKWGKEKPVSYKRSEQKNQNQESADTLVNKEDTAVKVPVDFNKLQPFTTQPQEGDILAYRLIELLSSWSPEVSHFRVGKISNYDPESQKVTLIQVPEYPIVFENDGAEESAEKLDMSPYNEDGSLVIDYSSLIDVRIVELGNLNSTKPTTPVNSKATWGDQNASSSRSRSNSWKGPKGKKAKSSTQVTENGKETSWDDICAALEAKKAQLAKKDNWTTIGTTSGASWSYRALRGSALGPTMAILRSQNKLR